MKEFIAAWAPLFDKHDVKLYVVWDLDEVPLDLADYDPSDQMSRACVPDFIPTGTDMIRSWGFYQAWRDDSRYILTLDDDVRPLRDPFEAYEDTFLRGVPRSRFLNVGALTTSRDPLRGFPYRDRRRVSPAVQYGAWQGVLDYDAATQLSQQPHEHHGFSHIGPLAVPVGTPVTTCIMNCAFRRDFTPAMWQLPMLDGRYNRFGDIWSGLFQKRVLDILGDVMLINGRALVRHERASDPFTNLERELPGLRLNEILADVVFDPAMPTEGAFGARIEEQDLATVYRCVTDWASAIFPHEYRAHFLRSRDAWLELFA